MANFGEITTRAYPRVSIAGNPSDGFWGKCVSMAFSNYSAKCSISPSNTFTFKGKRGEKLDLGSFSHLLDVLDRYFPSQFLIPKEIEEHKLILANVKTFFDFCKLNDIKYEPKSFFLSYSSNIPYSLGFSGSTAISIAVLRNLRSFYKTEIFGDNLESMALHAETHELGRIAGPQDPVSVNRKACVYMDFSKEAYKKTASGKNLSDLEKAVVHVDYSSSHNYLSNPNEKGAKHLLFSVHVACPEIEFLDDRNLPFFIITGGKRSDSSIELSPNIHAYRTGNKRVIEAMGKISALAPLARDAILKHDMKSLGEIITENFELSVEYFDNEYLGTGNINLVREAIKEGAYAKFPGSGGAVFGLYPNEDILQKLKRKFEDKGYKIEKVYPIF